MGRWGRQRVSPCLGTPACVAVSWDAIVCHHRVLGVVAVIPGEHQSTIVSRAWHNIAIVSKEPTRQKVNIVVSRIDGYCHHVSPYNRLNRENLSQILFHQVPHLPLKFLNLLCLIVDRNCLFLNRIFKKIQSLE